MNRLIEPAVKLHLKSILHVSILIVLAKVPVKTDNKQNLSSQKPCDLFIRFNFSSDLTLQKDAFLGDYVAVTNVHNQRES